MRRARVPGQADSERLTTSGGSVRGQGGAGARGGAGTGAAAPAGTTSGGGSSRSTAPSAPAATPSSTDTPIAGGSTGAASSAPSASASATARPGSDVQAADRPEARFRLPTISIERMLLMVGVPLLAMTLLVLRYLLVPPPGRHRRL